jgi:hypothetical protein
MAVPPGHPESKAGLNGEDLPLQTYIVTFYIYLCINTFICNIYNFIYNI